jgi:transcriptional regulator with GAF, ATPase, and Fis domain
MKNAEIKENIKRRTPEKEDVQDHIYSLQQQVKHFKKEKDFILALSGDITGVRGKNDLIKIFSSRLKGFFHFSHLCVALVDDEQNISLLTDEKADPIVNTLLAKKYPFTELAFAGLPELDVPKSYLLEKIIDRSDIPAFIKLNYDYGMREILITPLKRKMETLGFIFIYSERTSSFTDTFKSVLYGIAPHLFNAFTNIIINEEIAQREEEKSMLLSLSNEIALLRRRDDLLWTVGTRIKTLFDQSDLGIVNINDDNTYSVFVSDVSSEILKADPYIHKIISTKYNISDPIWSRVMKSDDPIVLDVASYQGKEGMPDYVSWWVTVGLHYLICKSMRAGGKDIGFMFLHTHDEKPREIKVNLMNAISAQLAVAISNILANEQISKKHEEQTFLLDFSGDIARVRTKPELQEAISKVLYRTMHTRLAMIHVIEDDNFSLSPFMYDSGLFETANSDLRKQVFENANIKSPYSAQVLASIDGVVFNVNEELKSGNVYAKLWETTGLKNIYGLPLRAGSKNLGIIWILADRLSAVMLRGICAQISIAIANIQANEKLLAYKKQLEGENDYLKEQIKTIYNASDIIGTGPQMQKVYYLMSLVAESNSTVLLLGETGTGKELIARAIHNSSLRKNKLMVKVNCAALPANLIESELFGHEKGSFTGAIERRIGKFELANNSTLFLDEIGEIPLETQSKLLRILQERELERVGGKTTINVDVRVIAATNRNLENEVKAGRFRADLYYRLNVFPITLPPLKDRQEDIVPLTYFFLEKYNKISGKKVTSISAKCLEELKSYTWPGNVRELEHLIERNILLTQGNVLSEIQLPRDLNQERKDRLMADGNTNTDIQLSQGAKVSSGLQTEQYSKSLGENEREYILSILKKCNGRIGGEDGAAKILKVPATTRHSKMKKLGIRKDIS